jgi:hypothetical protein
MTGPLYPPGPVAGSNAIGSFQIGVSPIGTIPSFDPWSTIISQYANSPVLDALVTSFASALDQTENFDNFFDAIFNVDTAFGVGLDIWGRIVGIGRVIHVPVGGPYLGFDEANDPSHEQPFGNGIFFSGSVTQNYALNDTAFRTLIFAKALANIWDGSIPGLNNILLTLFPDRGDCYVADGLNMTMTYTFTFHLSDVETTIVEGSGVLPQPAGVAISYSTV